MTILIRCVMASDALSSQSDHHFCDHHNLPPSHHHLIAISSPSHHHLIIISSPSEYLGVPLLVLRMHPRRSSGSCRAASSTWTTCCRRWSLGLRRISRSGDWISMSGDWRRACDPRTSRPRRASVRASERAGRGRAHGRSPRYRSTVTTKYQRPFWMFPCCFPSLLRT